MRDLILSIGIPAALIYALCSARGSILVLTWMCFQRPQDFSYGVWNTLPTFTLALAIAIVSNVMRGEFKPKFTSLLVIQLIFMLWVTMSAALAFDTAHAWTFYGEYAPALLVTPFVVIACVNDLDLLKKVLWVAVGSIALNGFKTGVAVTLGGGGHLTEQISGFVGDNNVFGLVLCVVVAMSIGLRSTLPDKRWVRAIFWGVIAANVMCIIYTKSRGALITLGIIALLGAWKSGKRIRYTSLLFAIVITGYAVIPAEYFDRLDTLKNVSDDRSAMGRVESWELAWREALRHPIFGVGVDNHMLYNAAMGAEVELRVAHNVYLQTLGELGFPALLLYLMFLIGAILAVRRATRDMAPIARDHPDLAWVRDLSFWMYCAFIGYSFGSGLLNMLYIEFPWHAMLLGGLLMPMVRKELARRAADRSRATPEEATSQQEGRPNILGVRGSGKKRAGARSFQP